MRFCLAHVLSIIYHFYGNWQQSVLWDAEKEKGLSFYVNVCGTVNLHESTFAI